MKKLFFSFGLLTAMGVGMSTTLAARKGHPAQPQVELTESGKQLAAKYTALVSSLKTAIAKDLPALSESKRAAFEKAHAAVESLQGNADTSQHSASQAKDIEAKIANWKKFWLGKADKGIQTAQAALKSAKTDAERDAARADLAKWQANKEDGLKHIAEAEADLAKARQSQPALAKANQQAQDSLTQARNNELNAAKAMLADVDPYLSSDKHDALLVKCALLTEATPAGLAAFAEQGKEQEQAVAQLLSDDKLMKEMLVAGGASLNKYGQAIEIYRQILKVSPRAAEDGILHRLALATSLELANPVKQTNAADESESAQTIDPVKRYQHYEKAYQNGELDPAFKTLNAWELRMVVDETAPDEILAWGREMLRTYRPDIAVNPNYGWRYSQIVRTDVPYGSSGVKNDLPSLNSFQNIIKNGGVCGRRAFFGRFILRAYGIPVWGVTQHKHAALSHWTPTGWVVNLGAGFDHSWWDKGDVSQSGPDFLLESQARRHPQEYLKVLRAQWVSRILGEEAYNGRKNIAGGPWSSMAHNLSKMIASNDISMGPLGEDLAEANESNAVTTAALDKVTVGEADQKVVVAPNGVITIPAAACSGKITLMKSFDGGHQLLGDSGTFSCTLDVARPGKYAIVARVVTVHNSGKLQVTVNNAAGPAEIAIPYTLGKWQATQPVEVTLVRGKNQLTFQATTRFGLKDFTLTPAK